MSTFWCFCIYLHMLSLSVPKTSCAHWFGFRCISETESYNASPGAGTDLVITSCRSSSKFNKGKRGKRKNNKSLRDYEDINGRCQCFLKLSLMNKNLYKKKKMLSPTAPLLTAQCTVHICITFAFGAVNFIKMPLAKIKIYSVTSSALISPSLSFWQSHRFSTP